MAGVQWYRIQALRNLVLLRYLRGRVHLFLNINEFVKNNCCIKNTEMIFTLYIPSWGIHNINVKLELALPQ